MLIGWFLSMWLSNAATAAMLMPIAIAVAEEFDSKQNEHVFSISKENLALLVVTGCSELNASSQKSTTTSMMADDTKFLPLEIFQYSVDLGCPTGHFFIII